MNLMHIMKKEGYEKRKRKPFYDWKKRRNESWHLNFFALSKYGISLTLLLIIDFFNIHIGLLIKIVNRINNVLKYLSIIKIITEMEIKGQIKLWISLVKFFSIHFLTFKLFIHFITLQMKLVSLKTSFRLE